MAGREWSVLVPGTADRRKLGAIVLIAGAVLVLLGCLLAWFEVTADLSSIGGPARSQAIGGLATPDGKIFLGVAIAMAGAALVLLSVGSRGAAIATGISAAAGAAFVAGFGVFDALTSRAQAIDQAAGALGGLDATEARGFLGQLFDAGVLRIDVRAGLWIVVLGALVGFVGAVATLTARPPRPVELPAPPPPPPLPDRPAT